MKARMSIRSIIMVMAIIGLLSMFFINISFATNTGKIKTETARLREQPQTDSKVLDLASIGEEVEILEEVDGWYKVKYKNITGYIRTDLVEVKNKEENVVNNEETKNVETESTTENTQVENNLTSENEIVENSNTETNVTEVQEKVTIEKGKYKVVDNVKLKIIPLISSIELNEISKDTEIEVTEVLNDWAKIKSADGKEGWVRTEKLATIQDTNSESDSNKQNEETAKTEDSKTEENTATTEKSSTQETTKTMYVNSKTVNLRQKADKTSQVVKQLSINTQVTVMSTDNGWSYVDINGTKGYIAESLLSSSKQETSRGTLTERNTTNNTAAAQKNENTASKSSTANTATTANKSAANSSLTNSTVSQTGSSVVSYAKQFLGCKYVYGGTSTSGFDCSGFTQYVYKHFGVNLNRTAAAQYSNGTAVTSLQAGDLVMFGKSGINHVGIYIGGNTFIHAANPSKGVTTTSLSSSYYKANYVGARRIF